MRIAIQPLCAIVLAGFSLLNVRPASALEENRILARAICHGQTLAIEAFLAEHQTDLNTPIPVSPQHSLRPVSLAMVCLQSSQQRLLPDLVRSLAQKPDNELTVLEKLLRFGAQAAYQEPDLNMGSPLHLIFDQPPEIQPQLLKLLLSFDGDAILPARNRKGQTVQELAFEKNPALGRYLLSYRPGMLSDLNIRLQPFAYAASSKMLEAFKQQEQLVEAYENRRFQIAKTLLEKGFQPDLYLLEPVGRPLLHAVALNNQRDWFELLLSHGANPGIRDYQQRELLHILAEQADADLKWYVEQGASVHARDAVGESPLFYAVRAGLANQVSQLLKLGANPNVKNYAGQTALELARELEKTNPVQYRSLCEQLEQG